VRGGRRSNNLRAISGPNITKQTIQSLLSDSNAYLGQQHEVVTLPGTPSTVTTTVTTGVHAVVYSANFSNIAGFTRFSNAWDEYRIIQVDFELCPSTVSTGSTAFWYDEKSNAVPTSLESQEKNVTRFCNTNASSKIRRMRWQPRDLLDLEFLSTSSLASNNVFFKAYTSAALWGAPIVATDIWVIRPIITVELRGLKST
jgi:hypothetical protein